MAQGIPPQGRPKRDPLDDVLGPAADPLDSVLAPPDPMAKWHAAYKSGSLARRNAILNANDRGRAQDADAADTYLDRLGSLAIRAAGNLPGGSAALTATRKAITGEPWKDAAAANAADAEEAAGSLAERGMGVTVPSSVPLFGGSHITLADLPAGAAGYRSLLRAAPGLGNIVGGAAYTGAVRATDPRPESAASRAGGTALAAVLGAAAPLVGKAGEMAGLRFRANRAPSLDDLQTAQDAARTRASDMAFERFRGAGDLGTSPELENVIGGTRQVPKAPAAGARGDAGGMRSMSRISDADLAAEYRRLVDANAADEATRVGWKDNPAYMERHELMGGGHVEDARGVGGYDPDVARAAAMAEGRIKAREQSIAAIEQEIERRGLESGAALNPDGGLGQTITGGATTTERVPGVGIIEDAMRQARKENSTLRDAAPTDARLLGRTYQIASDRAWQQANGYSSAEGVREFLDAIEPLAQRKGVSLREANAAFSEPSGEMDFRNRGFRTLQYAAAPKGAPPGEALGNSPAQFRPALSGATEGQRNASIEGLMARLQVEPTFQGSALGLPLPWFLKVLPAPSRAMNAAPDLLAQAGAPTLRTRVFDAFTRDNSPPVTAAAANDLLAALRRRFGAGGSR